MPHIPGHNRPFTSFLTQGMNNTNQNLNTMNRPNNSMPKGPGQIPMGQNFMMNPNNPKPGLSAMGQGFDVNNDGVVNMFDATATTFGMSPFDWTQSTGTGQFTFDDYIESFYQGGLEQGLYQNEGNLMHESATDWYENLYPGTQQDLQGQFNNPEYATNEYYLSMSDFNLEEGSGAGNYGLNPLYGLRYVPGAPTPGAATTANMGSYYDMGYGEESQQGFLENLMSYVNPLQSAPQQFTGGGGTGGQRARDLYYPGTSGGFAGVGQGLKGGGMQDMLKNMMG